jgi:ubiquinone/menaquinone biosynthesis C-methylase UbiE
MSFDSLAPLYDQTRMTSSRALDESLDYITERFPPLQFEHIFEPGIGTGRIAFPLAQRGYTITGVDPSANMLTVLQSRLTQEPAAITSHEGDATDLPFSDESFNMSVVVHVFDFIRNWKKAAHEIMRVTDKDGPIIAINTGSGSQIPSLSTRYKELCAEEGHPIIKLGAQSTRQVIDYFEVNEYQVEHIQNRWRWDNHLTPAEALSYIDQRAYSFTTTAPAAIHQRVMPRLTAEATEQYGDLSVPVAVPNEIKLDIICKNDPPAGMLSRAR